MKVFSRKDSLKRHCSARHGQNEKYCKLCDKHIPRLYNYMRHLQQKHSANKEKNISKRCGQEYAQEILFVKPDLDGDKSGDAKYHTPFLPLLLQACGEFYTH